MMFSILFYQEKTENLCNLDINSAVIWPGSKRTVHAVLKMKCKGLGVRKHPINL